MNYYNENDSRAAAWLQALIDNKLIPNGRIDTRSITEVSPSDLRGFIQCHFFCGIAGWPLALSLAGWPQDRPVWTGSCPCQPFSDAGQGKGEADPRHLWPAWFKLIRVCRPREILGEQVASKAALVWFDGVSSDLEGAFYATGAFDLCSAGVGAPNIRQRLYWAACDTAIGIGAGMVKSTLMRCEDRASLHGELHGSCAVDGCLSDVPARCVGDADRERLKFDAGGPSEFDRLDDTPSSRLGRPIAGTEGASRDEARLRVPGSGCQEDRSGVALGDTSSQGLPFGSKREGRGSMRHEGQASDTPGALERNFWSDFELIYCRDGKVRRIEPGLEPLVAGLSGRVGRVRDIGAPLNAKESSEGRIMRLRGYGNAINVEIAAEFIRAYLETLA